MAQSSRPPNPYLPTSAPKPFIVTWKVWSDFMFTGRRREQPPVFWRGCSSREEAEALRAYLRDRYGEGCAIGILPQEVLPAARR